MNQNLSNGFLLGLMVVGLWVFAPGVARAENAATSFDAANKLYYEGKFEEAAAAYEKLLQAGQKSSVMYFNLGNALFKSGRIGEAIASYQQARQLSPRDPDIQANLRFARNQVQGPTLTLGRVDNWLGQVTVNEWAIIASVSLWIFFALLILVQFRPLFKQALRLYVGLAAMGVAIFCGIVVYAFQQQRTVKTAIVKVPDAIVRHGPLEASPNAFSVHNGAEMRILDRKDDWLQVSTDPKRIGWIHSQDVLVPSS